MLTPSGSVLVSLTNTIPRLLILWSLTRPDTLLTVINDILDFSKLEAGKMKLFSVPLNLHETITEVVRALTYTNLERGLQTIEDLELDHNLLVLGDPVR